MICLSCIEKTSEKSGDRFWELNAPPLSSYPFLKWSDFFRFSCDLKTNMNVSPTIIWKQQTWMDWSSKEDVWITNFPKRLWCSNFPQFSDLFPWKNCGVSVPRAPGSIQPSSSHPRTHLHYIPTAAGFLSAPHETGTKLTIFNFQSEIISKNLKS